MKTKIDKNYYWLAAEDKNDINRLSFCSIGELSKDFFEGIKLKINHRWHLADMATYMMKLELVND